MIGFIKSFVRVKVMRLAQRFVRNTPTNTYERIVFDALRAVFTTFGEAQPA